MNNNFENRKSRKRFIFFPLVAIAFVALAGWVVMQLWNFIIPAVIPSVNPLNYWQAVGLLVLCRLLFGGFKGGGGWRSRSQMKGQMWREKMGSMTDEEKEQFKEAWKARCGRRN